MSPDRWKQIEEIFQAALDLAPEERAPYVERACAGDPPLREQVVALVKQFERADSLEDSQARSFDESQLFATPRVEETDPMEGRRIGAYRLVREIGRGGMGAVYLAERADSEFQRRVAIKLVKRGMDTDFVLKRFRNERQILASLNHPNIARLLDGGTTDDGLPYFVMEYIQGLPVYRYCDEHRLDLRARLQLFAQVCAAVQYAHQNLVIHRDIKPNNILVTAAGVPKLLDFGIAKLLNPELAADTSPMTATAMRLMTPEYASPEQVQGHAVTPASDIYSLGVLLYELLTGHRPYRIRHRGPHEVARVICEEEPERPSIMVANTDEMLTVGDRLPTLETLSRARAASPEELRRELAGGLEQIIMKALRKEPQRRYRSAEELREDIVSHLEGRPVKAPAYFPAQRPSRAAATDREPTGEKTLAVLPLTLLSPSGGDKGEAFLGVGLADALITRLSNVRRLAVRPTSAVLRYGERSDDPLGAGRELGVQFVLDGRIRRAGERIRVTVQLLDVREGASVWAGQFDATFTDVLSLEDDMSERVAEALIPRLSGDERQQLAKRGTDNPEAFEAYLRGRYHWNTFTVEGFAEALVCYQKAVALAPDYALAYAGIADYYNWLGIFAVLPFADTSAAAKEAALKAVSLDDTLAEAYAALGFATLMHDFDWAACGRYLRRAVELNPNYVTGRLWYSYFLGMSGRFDEALAQVRRALELDPLTPIVPQTLCWMHYYSRHFEEAVASTRQLAAREPRYGLTHVFLSMVLWRTGRSAEGVEAAQRAVTLLGRSPYTLSYLAAACAAAGRAAEARVHLEEVERERPARYVSPYLLAMVYHNLGERERALGELERAVEIRDGRLAWLGVDPQFDDLRDEPRYTALLRRTNNPLASAPPSVSSAPPPPLRGRTTGEITSPETAAPPPDRGEAQRLFTAGRYFAAKRTADGLRQAIERFEDAVERDPTFAPAWAELADAYALLNWYVEPPPEDAFQRGLEAARRAVAADESLAEAHASLAFIKTHFERDFAGADAAFRRAIELNPESAISHRWYAFSLSATGRHDEALAQAMRAQELSPRSGVMAMAVANVLFHARRYDEAVAQCHRALELDPGSVAAHVVMRWSYEMMGKFSEALAIYEKERAFAGDTPTTRAKYAHVLAAAGRAEEARAILRELTENREEHWVTAYELALIYALVGDADEAFSWLERAREERAVGLTYLGVDPHFDALRHDRRFRELLRAIGLG